MASRTGSPVRPIGGVPRADGGLTPCWLVTLNRAAGSYDGRILLTEALPVPGARWSS